MKVTIKEKIELEVKYIEVDTEVRYWEDTYVNGVPDIDFYESKGVGTPIIPCAVQVKEVPNGCIYSDHWRWRPIINVEDGKIINWVKGVQARVHYKVCDGFSCTIKDVEGKVIIQYEDYAPKFMCPSDEGYGDHIIMDIDENGFIQEWQSSLVQEFIENYG